VLNSGRAKTADERLAISQRSSGDLLSKRARQGGSRMVQRFTVAVLAGTTIWLAAYATVSAQACAAPGTASTPCSGNCASIMVGSPQGTAGNTVQIPISFAQGPDDGQPGQGFDEVAAIAFTLGVPGTGNSTPLTFDCTSGNLSDGAVTPGAGIASNFTVVVENAQCTNRNRCLCADTTAGQTVDNFVNLVVYGPKNLPEQGPVQIPVLPASGTLLTLNMRLAANASGSIPLHIFSALPGGAATPQFGANLSIGDEAACDVTANTSNRSNVSFTDGTVTVGTPVACVGDCDHSGSVAINELIIGVNIALGSAQLSSCTAFDPNNDGMVSINELIMGVNNALNGCPAS